MNLMIYSGLPVTHFKASTHVFGTFSSHIQYNFSEFLLFFCNRIHFFHICHCIPAIINQPPAMWSQRPASRRGSSESGIHLSPWLPEQESMTWSVLPGGWWCWLWTVRAWRITAVCLAGQLLCRCLGCRAVYLTIISNLPPKFQIPPKNN